MSAVLRLIRPVNCLMGVVGVLIGAMVGIGLDIFSSKYWFEISFGCVIAFFFMAAGNMMNDYFDRDLDKINHPTRPIPSGSVSAKDVLISACLIYVFLFILGLLLNLIMFFILLIALILMIGYEISLKRHGFVGNITISILVGLLFMFGAAAVLKFGVVIFLSLLAFLATLTREIVKDIEDIEGDIDRVTLPKKIGIKNAGIIAGVVIIIAVLLSPIPTYPEFLPFFKFEKFGEDYLYVIIMADALFIFSIVHFLRNTALASQTLKAGMAAALVAFIFGSMSL